MLSQRQGVRSTKVKIKTEEGEEEKKAGQDNEQIPTLTKQEDIHIKIHDTNYTMHTNQTDKFPHISIRGNRYQRIAYHVGSNSIWVEPMKNQTEGEMIQAR